MKKIIIISILLLSVFGFADATYLTIHYYQSDIALPCVVFSGCDAVTKSQYSSILGIPVALLGTLYYSVIFSLILFYIEKRKNIILRILPIVTFTGLAFSIWFTYAQIFLLHSICTFCLLSAISSTLIFILSYLLSVKNKQITD